ncbi:MAG TPA: glycoside hydrolase family 99-like domain-containing protein [Polyangiaceae bacterium]|nr:glycoside hydrolase family 99-like domain-containing protein [Polyangiaceae bacterium]
MARPVTIAAYVYPGFHPIPERDASFHPGFTEWELVLGCAPRFPGHVQPRVPALGPYDDRNPTEVGRRIALARAHGVDAFVYGLFWCRGKRVFEDALDLGFLGSDEGRTAPFAVMWANRMPRRVLPVARADAEIIDPSRLVSSDVDDFVALVDLVGRTYMVRQNYVRVEGLPYLSIFDSTFFVRELGRTAAADALRAAKAHAKRLGHPGLHVAAIDPAEEILGEVREIGFDSVTHYVHLPYWKGPSIQDYAETAERRSREWPELRRRSKLPYFPSVSPGWDASPRGADFGPKRPDKYPWSPVIVGESPEAFEAALRRALVFARDTEAPLVFVASLNEWSEGHYLEPDARFGVAFLEAVRRARIGSVGSAEGDPPSRGERP